MKRSYLTDTTTLDVEQDTGRLAKDILEIMI